MGFDSEEDIREKLGFDPAKCNTYICPICHKLHLASYPLMDRKESK
jgi:hypothetical protein